MGSRQNKPAVSRAKLKSNKQKGSKKKGSLAWRLVKWLIILAVLAGILGAGALAGVFLYFGQDLPQLLKREDYKPKQMTRIYAAGGELIGELIAEDGRRTVVAMEELPDYVRYSFMAAEDADFMTHKGIDYLGMIRAFYHAARYDTQVKGTSTITQQVVKNLMLTHDRKIQRKVKEIILARELDKNLSKSDILFLYLNTIYLGHGNYGVEEASRYYFGKSARDLTLAEASTLAGMTQSPERLSPKKHPEQALKRREYVLEQLWKKGFIEEATYRKTLEIPIETRAYTDSYPHLGQAPYLVMYVRDKLIEKYGYDKAYEGGLRVYTTIDIDKQIAARNALRAGLRQFDANRGYYSPIRTIKKEQFDAFTRKQAASLAKAGLKTNKFYEALVVSVDADKELVMLSLGDVPARLVLDPRDRILTPDPKKPGSDPRPIDQLFQIGNILQVVPQATEPDAQGSIPVVFRQGAEAALVSIDPNTRDVVALVGGFDFEKNEYNHATQARRQTGSTFKPFVYGAALEAKLITPATIYLDSPTVFKMPGGKSWSPKNSDLTWRGPIRVREGLGASRNVVAVRVLKDVGLEAATKFARKIGIHSDIVQNFTMVMGSSELTVLELTNAYATFASGGMHAEPRIISRVESVYGEKESFETSFERVLAPEVAYIITDLMTAVTMGYVDSHGKRRGGTASSLMKGLKFPVAGKTGTTNDSRDAWFAGFTPQYVTAAWVGMDNNESLGPRQYGATVAGPIWRDFMKVAHEGLEVKDFVEPPSGIERATIDPASGKLTRQGGVEEIFLSGTAPTAYVQIDEGGRADDFLMGQVGGSDADEDVE